MRYLHRTHFEANPSLLSSREELKHAMSGGEEEHENSVLIECSPLLPTWPCYFDYPIGQSFRLDGYNYLADMLLADLHTWSGYWLPNIDADFTDSILPAS